MVRDQQDQGAHFLSRAPFRESLQMHSQKPICAFIYLFIYFWWDWGLNSGLCTYKAGGLLLEPHLQVHFALVILEMGSHELFAPNLRIPSS
jgi:hypothetical protein